jgi:AmiR/NasT family two-component response regulator
MAVESKTRTTALRVLVADEDEAALKRTSLIFEGLGHEVIAHAVAVREATDAIAEEDPDLSAVLVHSDDEHALALIDEIGSFSSGPVVVLLVQDDQEFISAAAELGVDAFVRPTSAEALQSAIEVALRRYADIEDLTAQVKQLQTALDRRVIIERAKGMLMERHSLPERAAFELLRAHARASNETVVQTASEVIDGHELSPRS